MSITLKKGAVYLDNAASTPIAQEVQKEMTRVGAIYGNPSSFNDAGRKAKGELESARLKVARFLGARPEEIIFTSSGSEANNMAIMCSVFAAPKEKTEILATPIEHPSVLEPLKFLKYENKNTLFIKVDGNGILDLKDFESKLSVKTLLVTVMYANNEIGTIEPVKKAAGILKEFKKGGLYPLLHIDACQAAGYLDMNVNNIGADILTFNGTKIYGPKGVGVLYVKKDTPITPYIMGGGQERGYRAGTENLPAIAGLAKALLLINKNEIFRVAKLRDYLISEIKRLLPDTRVNGPEGNDRLPNNVNLSVPGLDSENLLLELDKYGIYASSGSACTARSVEPSHVLKAIGVEPLYLTGALRFSLGRQTRKSDIDRLIKILPKAVGDLKRRYKI